jgi:hypothetical protein
MQTKIYHNNFNEMTYVTSGIDRLHIISILNLLIIILLLGTLIISLIILG